MAALSTLSFGLISATATPPTLAFTLTAIFSGIVAALSLAVGVIGITKVAAPRLFGKHRSHDPFAEPAAAGQESTEPGATSSPYHHHQVGVTATATSPAAEDTDARTAALLDGSGPAPVLGSTTASSGWNILGRGRAILGEVGDKLSSLVHTSRDNVGAADAASVKKNI
jgi:hypothetical protein